MEQILEYANNIVPTVNVTYILRRIWMERHLFIFWTCAEKQADALKKVCKDIWRDVKNLIEIFWIN